MKRFLHWLDHLFGTQAALYSRVMIYGHEYVCLECLECKRRSHFAHSTLCACGKGRWEKP